MKASFLAFFLAALIFSSCSEDTIEPPVDTTITATTIRDLDADAAKTGSATYFRLRDSSVVTGADTATTNWDVAFRATTVFFNSGSSGPGQSAAQIVSGDFASLAEAPADGYRQDAPGAPAIMTGSDNSWYHYDPATFIISPIPGKIIVVKTADGKYAKLQILSYYKGAPATPSATDLPRYYSFRYALQSNGSRSF